MIFDQAWNRVKRMRLAVVDPVRFDNPPASNCPTCDKGVNRPHERTCKFSPYFGKTYFGDPTVDPLPGVYRTRGD